VKRETTWYGDKVLLTEICEDDSPHLITNVHTTHAAEPEVTCTEVIHQALAKHDRLPSEHIVDVGYMASTTLVTSPDKYAIDLLGPMRPDVSWQARTGSGFDFSQFTINWESHTVTCPQGKTSWHWREGIGPNGKPHIQTHFRRVDCQACPVRTQCTRDKQARQVTFPPQRECQALQAARQRQQTQDFLDRYAIRVGVEGTLSHAVFALGMRRTRYRSLLKVHLQHVLTVTAMNLLRVVHWLAAQPPSPTPRSAFAALVASLLIRQQHPKNGHARPDLLDHASNGGSGDVRKRFVDEAALTGAAIGGQNACRMNANQYLASLGFWAWDLIKLELFRPAVLVDTYRLHEMLWHGKDCPASTSMS
jgi:transposase